MSEELGKIENKVLSYDQELIILNKIIEIRNTQKVADELGVAVKLVEQLLWKYQDVIALIIQNKDLAEKVSQKYEEAMNIALESNLKAIKLLTRQIDILYEEFMSEANAKVTMKDYLIDQVCKIQDKLQKLIDQNEIRFKDNRAFLESRVKGFKEVQETQDTSTPDYIANSLTVFEQLKKYTQSNRNNIDKYSAATEVHFDLYEKDSTELYKHYNSVMDATRDGIAAYSTLARKVREAGKNGVAYIKDYKIQNVTRGVKK